MEKLAWDPKEANKQLQGLEGVISLDERAEIKLSDCILRVIPER